MPQRINPPHRSGKFSATHREEAERFRSVLFRNSSLCAALCRADSCCRSGGSERRVASESAEQRLEPVELDAKLLCLGITGQVPARNGEG